MLFLTSGAFSVPSHGYFNLSIYQFIIQPQEKEKKIISHVCTFLLLRRNALPFFFLVDDKSHHCTLTNQRPDCSRVSSMLTV